jgi:TPP-dependent pyruvate/acetoin dehydrogenase alpha subunit
VATDHGAREALPCADSDDVTREDRLALFRLVLMHRLIEERVGMLYRGGRVSGSVYTGRGQEAVAAAAGYAMGPDDVCAPLNRELACHLARGVTAAQAFRNFLGKGDSPTLGRDGNMHFGAPEHGVFPLVSMLGDLCPLTVGAALAFKRRGEPRVALTFWGDGAMSTGDVHEGLNLAAVLRVPAVFVLQSNGYAYSTPTSRQMINPCMADRVEGGWGIPASRVDGSDAIATLLAMRTAIEEARAGGGPRAVEAVTLRLDGHAAHDDGSYMDQEQLAEYSAQRDPVERLAARLRDDGLSHSELEALRASAADEVAAGLQEAEASPAPDPATILDGVYATRLT